MTSKTRLCVVVLLGLVAVGTGLGWLAYRTDMRLGALELVEGRGLGEWRLAGPADGDPSVERLRLVVPDGARDIGRPQVTFGDGDRAGVVGLGFGDGPLHAVELVLWLKPSDEPEPTDGLQVHAVGPNGRSDELWLDLLVHASNPAYDRLLVSPRPLPPRRAGPGVWEYERGPRP